MEMRNKFIQCSTMKLVIPIILAVTLAAVAQTSRSVGDGVYTPEQANRGKTAYVEQCASCHGAELGGGDETPALAGARFLAKWRNRSVDELFERVRVSMPPDRPGTLSRQRIADILAYIFAANKFPAGDGELGTQSETLKQIQFPRRAGQRAGTASRTAITLPFQQRERRAGAGCPGGRSADRQAATGKKRQPACISRADPCALSRVSAFQGHDPDRQYARALEPRIPARAARFSSRERLPGSIRILDTKVCSRSPWPAWRTWRRRRKGHWPARRGA